MRLVLLGLPGAGKGTQGDRISEKYGIPHISTGSIIREAIAVGAQLGQEANGYISKGDLVPDELALQIVHERIIQPDCSGGWILDGFPRTVLQASELDRRLATSGLDVQKAFDIRVTQAEAIERISKRRMCSQCGAVYHLDHYRAKGKGVCDNCGGELYRRTDDTEETARKRLAVYMRQT
ncbi:MAG TPA: adenylate kinase, partial [Firmicutes bacterium]|nr:adenylate kinase [Bacillota bacterium]